MKDKTVDVYFYVTNQTQPELMRAVADNVEQVAGVKKAGISPRMQQLLAVEYNPDEVSSSALVKFMRKSGYQAAMIGM